MIMTWCRMILSNGLFIQRKSVKFIKVSAAKEGNGNENGRRRRRRMEKFLEKYGRIISLL